MKTVLMDWLVGAIDGLRGMCMDFMADIGRDAIDVVFSFVIMSMFSGTLLNACFMRSKWGRDKDTIRARGLRSVLGTVARRVVIAMYIVMCVVFCICAYFSYTTHGWVS